MTAALSTHGVSKVFAGEFALNAVDLELESGEIHALIGANGSGKSTLIKILAGYHTPESGGELLINGSALEFGSPRASRASGLRFVHQDLGLVDQADVAENLRLGSGYLSRWWLSNRRERARARALLARYGLDLDPSALVGELPSAQRSMLAIVRAIASDLEGRQVLVLDEPTASLPGAEVHQLMGLVRDLKRHGVTVLFVTHRLQEVFDIADRVTVLRDGRRVATKKTSELTQDGLVELILGRRLSHEVVDRADRRGEPVLVVDDLSGSLVACADLHVRQGEIVGVAGLLGSGYESLLGLIFGVSGRASGRVEVCGQTVRPGNTSRSLRAGVSYAPAERRRFGSFMEWNVRENMTLASLKYTRFTGSINGRAEKERSAAWVKRLSIKPSNSEAILSELSGGNQQKVMLGRMLLSEPRVLLFDEPTIGVDAAAKSAIYTEIRKASAAGVGVLIASSDVEELAEICDRVLVFRAGRIAHELPKGSSPNEILEHCLGVT